MLKELWIGLKWHLHMLLDRMWPSGEANALAADMEDVPDWEMSEDARVAADLPADPTLLRGVLLIYADSGTEGGFWAFQDIRHSRPNTSVFDCSKCGLYWNKDLEPTGPAPTTDEERRDGQCASDAHAFTLAFPRHHSLTGLHILDDGDLLTVHEKGGPPGVVWQGIVRFRRSVPESDRHIWYRRTIAEQIGVQPETWEEWFAKGHPATLRPNKPRPDIKQP